MKRKIEIIGPKVHEVGYRYFLMNQAMLIGVDGFAALNQMGKNGQQEVLVIMEASCDLLDTFSAFAGAERPEGARSQVRSIGCYSQ